jgi:hypothetical protein
LNSANKFTVKRILFSYVTVAVCAVALGLTIVLNGNVGQSLMAVTGASSSVVSSAPAGHIHTPKFLYAEASTMPMETLDYAFLELETDGDASSAAPVVRVIPDWVDGHCEACFRIEYYPYIIGKAGFAWIPGQPLDVQGAERMTFWAKGEFGGEEIRIMILGKENMTSGTNPENLFNEVDFASRSELITLTSNFRPYQMEVPALETEKYNDITHLVAIELHEGDGSRPVTVYLKGFYFDAEEPIERYLLDPEPTDLLN